MRESSDAEEGSSKRAARVATRAANPEAEDARPAAVGKLFSDTMCSRSSDKGYAGIQLDAEVHARETITLSPAELVCCSKAFRSARISRKQFAILPSPFTSSSSPLSQSLSFWKEASALIVVFDLKWSCERVTDREEFVGKIKSNGSRFPQYLMTAIFYALNVSTSGGLCRWRTYNRCCASCFVHARSIRRR